MNTKSIVIFIVITLGILLGVGGLLWQFGSGGTEGKPIEGVAGAETHKQGEGTVMVVEFSDFQCPGCRAVHDPLKQVLSKYQGKVTFVYRYFPLTSIHKNALVAAQAAEAAGRQGKFWEMSDSLFSKQDEWANLSDPRGKFAEYANSLGLDQAKFMADLDSQSVKDAVNTDLADATKFNLQGTPTIFVNGVVTDFGKLDAKLAELTR